MKDDESRVVFALDFPNLVAARRAALAVRQGVGMLKVGLELFLEAGSAAVLLGREAELPVFLDLKLHDIPETVERAVARASALGARIATVHASGGPKMLERAVMRADKEGAGLQIAAVTVLTSLDGSDLEALGIGRDVAAHARRLGRLAYDHGVRTFVCSPHEVGALRAELGPDATLITPGVRATGTNETNEDQKRVATAARAVADGADWVVVGRPIRDASDPLATARALSQEVREARAALRGQRE